jgi:predicted ATPase/class 3 adenylate cyclase/Tfp pilus assembly protein PilF
MHHARVQALPTGTVTFLFTDIEGSTRLLHDLGDEYAAVLAEHRRVLRDAFGRHDGVEFGTEGDAFFVAFASARDAIAAAREGQEALASGPVRVRMGIHTGEPQVSEGDYVGIDVHRAARIAAAGHGGQILVSKVTRDLVGGEGLQDLGEHRLKDLAGAERIYQVGDAEFSPLKTLYRTNLPVQPTPLVGRERELGDVRALLDTSRLLTLTGPGGTGKTRLAIQAAAEVADRFSEGVFLVELAAVTETGHVLPAVAHAAGVAEAPPQRIEETLASALGSARILFVVDNFEQLVAAAPTLARLLSACRNVSMLVTSRAPLHVSAEREYAVPPLSSEEAFALFIERARAVRADFQLNGGALAVEAICERVDRLPLAIELAAARIKFLPPQKLLSMLEQRLAVLSAGARDLPERQRTLRSTIEWSYSLLSDVDREVFARLGIFARGCTFAAAEAVAGADFDTLYSLVDKSLVRQDEGPEAEPRFSLLETIREFALDRLAASGEQEEVARRHADFFLAFTSEAGPALVGPHQTRWLDHVSAEHENLRAVLEWSLGPGDLEAGLRIAGALRRYWESHAPSEVRTWLDQALPRASDDPTRGLAESLVLSGRLDLLRGDYDEAERQFERAQALFVAIGDARMLAFALSQLAYTSLVRGDYELTASRANEAVEAARASEDQWALMFGLNVVGGAAIELGDLASARATFEEAAALARANGDLANYGVLVSNVAEVAVRQGDYEAAVPLFEESLSIMRELADNPGQIAAILGLGSVANGRGRYAEAVELYEEGLRLLQQEGGEAHRLPEAFAQLAIAAAGQGDLARAAMLLGAGDAHYEQIGAAPGTAERARFEALLERVRTELGEAGERAYAAGRALTRDDAIAYALERPR